MDGHKFKIGDTVRINGDRRIWEVSDVGYSERMEENTYIVGCEGSKRKVLEHQLETAPVVFATGTRAAEVPAEAVMISREQYGANRIERYKSPDAIA